MTGTKTSGNPYKCDILWSKPIGEVVLAIIADLDYGKGTFSGKCVLEALKDEIVKRKGQAFFDEHYAFWSMNNAQQKAQKIQEAKEKHDKHVAQYLGLGLGSHESENLASAFPEGNPLEVVKIRTYANQTEIAKEKFEEPKRERQLEQERENKKNEIRKLENHIEEVEGMRSVSANPEQFDDFLVKAKQRLAELKEAKQA